MQSSRKEGRKEEGAETNIAKLFQLHKDEEEFERVGLQNKKWSGTYVHPMYRFLLAPLLTSNTGHRP